MHFLQELKFSKLGYVKIWTAHFGKGEIDAQACLANIFLAGMEDGVSLERLSGSFFYIFLLSVLWKKVTNMKYGLWWRVQWGGCGAFWQPLALLAAVDRLTLGTRFSLSR